MYKRQGYARVLDRDSGGLDVDWRRSPADTAGVKRLVINGDVGIGELQVVNNRSDFIDWETDDRVDESFHFGSDGPAPIPATNGNAACAEAA